jgi:TRAP-type C4-dicarboxylate transport system permease small subunit
MPGRSSRPLPNSPPGCGLAGVEALVRGVALWGGGLTLLGLVGLTVADVVLRYGFNAPLFGARDVAKLLLLAMVALSTAYSARTGGQVAIELFGSFMGPRMRGASEVCVRAAGIAMLLALAWRLGVNGASAGRFGEASLALGIPFKAFYWLLAFGMLLYALVLAVEIPVFLRGRAADFRFPPH